MMIKVEPRIIQPALVMEPRICLLEDVTSGAVAGLLLLDDGDCGDVVGAEGDGFITSNGAGWEMTFVFPVAFVGLFP
jgi:hypothetical protein